MKINVNDMKETELNSKLEELRMELMKTKTKLSSGGQPAKGQPSIKNLKKNIARIKTKITEVSKKES
jgi:ribosomal protein L29